MKTIQPVGPDCSPFSGDAVVSFSEVESLLKRQWRIERGKCSMERRKTAGRGWTEAIV